MDRASPLPSVLVCGGATWDGLIGVGELPRKPGTVFSSSFHETVGGTGAGKALNLARLGFPTSLHAFLGDDEPGRRAAEALRAGGVEFLHEGDPAGTERHVNILDGEGRRISIYCSYGTFEPEFDLPALERRAAESGILVLNIINYCRRLIPAATASGRELWIDIHDYDGKNPYHRDFLEAADCLFLSSDSMRDWRSFMRRMIKAGKRLVVCTHGAKGASALDRSGRLLSCAAVRDFGYVDANGAGDAFFSGYLAASVRGLSPLSCLRMGSLSGALCVASKELANPSMDWDRLLAEYRRVYGEAAE